MGASDVELIDSECNHILLQLRPRFERQFHRGIEVHRRISVIGQFFRGNGHAPERIMPIRQHQHFERVLGCRDRLLRVQHILLKCCDLRLSLHDIHRGKKTLRYLTPIA